MWIAVPLLSPSDFKASSSKPTSSVRRCRNYHSHSRICSVVRHSSNSIRLFALQTSLPDLQSSTSMQKATESAGQMNLLQLAEIFEKEKKILYPEIAETAEAVLALPWLIYTRGSGKSLTRHSAKSTLAPMRCKSTLMSVSNQE